VLGYRHDVVPVAVAGAPNAALECARDCAPRKRYFNARVFELSRSGEGCGELIDEECPVGQAGPDDVICTYDADQGGVRPGQPGGECIVDALTARVALYRGRSPSTRGMAFTWTTAGGFIPLVMSLTSQSASVLPQSMLYLPELQHLAVVDASTLGLTLFSIDSLLMEAAYY
jgi:hypothetical protein